MAKHFGDIGLGALVPRPHKIKVIIKHIPNPKTRSEMKQLQNAYRRITN